MDQPDNIYRGLREAVVTALDDAGITAVGQVEPLTSKAGNDALNDTGEFVVVGYQTVSFQEANRQTVELPVQVMVNPEIAEHDGEDLALSVKETLADLQLDQEWWTELRVTGMDPTGTEDGLVVWTVTVQTHTIESIERI